MDWRRREKKQMSGETRRQVPMQRADVGMAVRRCLVGHVACGTIGAASILIER